jgi:hypothetical protein
MNQGGRRPRAPTSSDNAQGGKGFAQATTILLCLNIE